MDQIPFALRLSKGEPSVWLISFQSRQTNRLDMYVIGTAGHVDHGKSTLVQALTGIDPDRLAEEKTRGMTIDLGFAWLKLPGGLEVSIVDVPGHERFIKNMLAGVGGIDMALLVIAADEGVMPQTREHLAILDLLGVSRGIVVMTKSDLVDSDWLDLVSADVEEVLEGTTLAGAPIARCSAVTGDGLPELLSLIEAQLDDLPTKRDLGRPRLPIDRVFTVVGFGTVVTGTLIDGSLTTGQEVEVLPALVGGHLTSLRTRIRGLQTHRSAVQVALPGTRTAANLGGVSQDALSRGQVVTTPGWLQPSMAVDVRLKALDSLPRTLRHNLHVTFHCYASETPARLRLLEADETLPGEEVWAQLRLSRPVAVLKGDRFVIRDANDTLGGGVIVDTQVRRHPRRRPSVIAALERLQAGSPSDKLYEAIAAVEPVEPSVAVQRTDLARGDADVALKELVEQGRVVVLGQGDAAFAYTRDGFERLSRLASEAVEAYLTSHPLRRGLGKEELRNRLNLPQRQFTLVLDAFVKAGALVDTGAAVSTTGWEPRLSPSQAQAADAYLALLRSAPTTPPADQAPDVELLAHLVEKGDIVDVGNNTVFAADAYERMIEAVVAHLRQRETITMAEARDLLGSSRRYVQPFLESLDAARITLRRGDERVLGPRAPSA
ncbi:MAG TPA: selenocysteine-specific translation elongation factor [Dehalococcoidia bacterium]|nr:selenocysteine-specific translation elongation factor [Dehalococcoidia bacterium]